MTGNGNGSLRAERAAELRRRRDAGESCRATCAAMGISHTYYYGLIHDPDGSAARARKDSYRGTCVDCGAPTDGSNGAAAAPEYCYRCSARHVGEAKRVWTHALVIARIREWAQLHGEPPAGPDWFPPKARQMHDEARARRFEDAWGHWPWMPVVVRLFGSWNGGLLAAGFEPRAPHGGNGNERRKRRFRHEATATAAGQPQASPEPERSGGTR